MGHAGFHSRHPHHWAQKASLHIARFCVSLRCRLWFFKPSCMAVNCAVLMCEVCFAQEPIHRHVRVLLVLGCVRRIA